ncbi:MAG: hypothetical protein MJZ79_08245 [Paludibacteraceae bacterium]|nr:hypothetical protein [Paludibacteraceae bacterium]
MATRLLHILYVFIGVGVFVWLLSEFTDGFTSPLFLKYEPVQEYVSVDIDTVNMSRAISAEKVDTILPISYKAPIADSVTMQRQLVLPTDSVPAAAKVYAPMRDSSSLQRTLDTTDYTQLNKVIRFDAPKTMIRMDSDSLAQYSLHREQQEAVTIKLHEDKEPWYITWEDITTWWRIAKDYYQTHFQHD